MEQSRPREAIEIFLPVPMALNDLEAVRRELKAAGDAKRAEFLQRFFKTGPGQYAEGDILLGVSMPVQRRIAAKYADLDMGSISALLDSPLHEERLTGLLILVAQFRRADENTRRKIFDFYVDNIHRVNNWDLVDSSARDIVGRYLADKDRSSLYRLAESSGLWERRIAVIATHAFIQEGEFDDTLRIVRMLLGDKQDLIHKAAGWMLREIGKRSPPVLESFLDRHAAEMPRTMLRYAIERFPAPTRLRYLQV